MSISDATHDNIKALEIHEDFRVPQRWAGVVERNHGRYEVEDIALKGQTLYSQEWYIEIRSDSLLETVFARVNKDREEGKQVQFNLDRQTDFPAQPHVDTQNGKKGRVVGTTWFEDHPEWREGMFPTK